VRVILGVFAALWVTLALESLPRRQLLNEQINTYRDKSHYNKVHSPYLHRSKERSYDFNASGDSLLITVTINQSNIDNYGNVGTIQIRTTECH
jgi:hypothetical protein